MSDPARSSSPSPLPNRFEARLHFLSDWSVGSGRGRAGQIDQTVLVDAAGIAYVPAKTLTGIWRDACEQVARGLDGNDGCQFQAWVDWLFGDQPAAQPEANGRPPRPARLRIRPAEFDPDLRRRLASSRRLRDALIVPKPGVALSSTGVATTKMLRFEERVMAGSELCASVELDRTGDIEADRAASFVVLAGAAWMDHLGGGRRRGAGALRVRLCDAGQGKGLRTPSYELSDFLAWVESVPLPAPPGEDMAYEPKPLPLPLAGPDDTPELFVRLEITLGLPLLTQRRTLGNVVEGHDHLPGTYLLPHVTKALTGCGIDVRDAVARGDLVLTPAYPLDGTGRRSLPVPLAYFRIKPAVGAAANDSTGSPVPAGNKPDGAWINRLFEPPDSKVQLKGLRTGYMPMGEEGLSHGAVFEPKRTVRMHNAIDDTKQRPSDGTGGGGLFTYDALASVQGSYPGASPTRLMAELRLRGAVAAAVAQNPDPCLRSLSGPVSLGRSRKDDYGKAEIRAVFTPAPWPVAGPQDNGGGSHLSVWLLSGALCRNARLGPGGVDEFARELGNRLDVALELKAFEPGGLAIAAGSFRLESWHGGWNLPRPTLLGLSAGSCLVFALPAGTRLDPKRVQEVQSFGIGERRAEGYGQVWLNPPILGLKAATSFQVAARGSQTPEGDVQAALPLDESGSDEGFARALERRAWRLFIASQAASLASGPWPNPSDLSQSQAGILRAVASGLTPEDRPDPDRGGERPAGVRALLERWHLESNALFGVFTKPDCVWEYLQLQSTVGQITVTRDGEKVLREQLWAEAVRAVVDASVHWKAQQSVVGSADAVALPDTRPKGSAATDTARGDQ